MVAIKLNNLNKFLAYCDNCWFESSNNPLFIFQENQINNIAQQLQNHYIYNISIISQNGNTQILNAFNNTNIISKKSISKIKVKF